MKIDEAINKLNAHKLFDLTLAIPIEIVVGELLSTKTELEWYKSQDLIRRDDVWNCKPEWLNEHMEDAIKSTHNKGWNKCNLEWCDTIKQIPKAEPPFAKDTNVPDKLATDTNVAHKE